MVIDYLEGNPETGGNKMLVGLVRVQVV